MMRTAKSLPNAPVSNTYLLTACLAMLAGSPSVGGEVNHIIGDWTVRGDTSLRDPQIRLDGSLILPARAKLTLEDCTLEIAGEMGEATVKGNALLTGDGLSVRNVRFRTEGSGRVELRDVQRHGTIAVREDRGSITITERADRRISNAIASVMHFSQPVGSGWLQGRPRRRRPTWS